MFDKNLVAKSIFQKCHLNGEFVLRSGRIATEYFDKYQISSDAALLDVITREMAKYIPDGTEVLAGLEMGAIPIVTMLSHHTGIPAAFVRKIAKKHGTAKLAEGADIRGKRVLVVEDIVTSGGQIILSTSDMRDLGAIVDSAIIVIDREEGGREALKESGINLISLFQKCDFKGLWYNNCNSKKDLLVCQNNNMI